MPLEKGRADERVGRAQASERAVCVCEAVSVEKGTRRPPLPTVGQWKCARGVTVINSTGHIFKLGARIGNMSTSGWEPMSQVEWMVMQGAFVLLSRVVVRVPPWSWAVGQFIWNTDYFIRCSCAWNPLTRFVIVHGKRSACTLQYAGVGGFYISYTLR